KTAKDHLDRTTRRSAAVGEETLQTQEVDFVGVIADVAKQQAGCRAGEGSGEHLGTFAETEAGDEMARRSNDEAGEDQVPHVDAVTVTAQPAETGVDEYSPRQTTEMKRHGDECGRSEGGKGVSDGVDEGAGAPVEAVLAAGFDEQNQRQGKEDEAAPLDEASAQRSAKSQCEPGAEQQAIHAAREHLVGVLRAASVRDDSDAQPESDDRKR